MKFSTYKAPIGTSLREAYVPAAALPSDALAGGWRFACWPPLQRGTLQARGKHLLDSSGVVRFGEQRNQGALGSRGGVVAVV